MFPLVQYLLYFLYIYFCWLSLPSISFIYFCLFPQNRKTALHITINTTPAPAMRIKCVCKCKVILWKFFPWELKNFQDTIIQSITQQSLGVGRPILETKRNFYDTSLPAPTRSVQAIRERPIQECIHDMTKSSSSLLCQLVRKLYGSRQGAQILTLPLSNL